MEDGMLGSGWVSRVTVAAVMVVAGCGGLDLVAPGPPVAGDGELTAGGLHVSLTLSASTVAPPGLIVAELRYDNRGAAPVTVTSSYGCLSFAGVYRDGLRIPFPSTEYACTAAVTNRELAPGAVVGMEWPLEIGGVELPPGSYVFVAHLNTHPYELVRTFVVQ
jgi:hypothetical protein